MPGDLLAHADFLRGLVRSLLRDEHAREDVMQETWVAALERSPARLDAPRAWLATVARNAFRQMLRRDGRRTARERGRPRDDGVPSPEEIAGREEARGRVVAAVLDLPETYRSVVLLRFFEDLAPAEIAARLGLPGATVRTRLRRALQRLRERLDGEYGGRRDTWTLLLLPLARFPGRHAAAGATGAVVGGLLVTLKTKLALGLAAVAIVAAALLVAVVSRPPADVPSPRDARKTAAPVGAVVGSADAAVADVAEDETGALEVGHRVRVLAGDAPVAGARISATLDDGRTLVVETEEDGVAALPPDARGFARLWVRAEGHALTGPRPATLERGETVVRLEAGGRVVVRFVDPARPSSPVPGSARRMPPASEVLVLRNSSLGGGLPADHLRMLFGPVDAWRTACGVEATEEGFALRRPLAEGSWRLLVRRPGTVPFLTPAFSVGAGRIRRVDVPLPLDPPRCRLRVVAADTGEALAGATVRPYLEHGDDQAFFPGPELRTDASGEVRLPVRLPDSRRSRGPTWWILAPGRAARVSEAQLPASGTLEVRVFRTVRVVGRAFGADGEPAAGRTVLWQRKGHRVWTTVDAGGCFALDGVPLHRGVPGESTTLWLIEDVERGRVVRQGVRLAPGATAEVTIGEPKAEGETAETVTIEGRVTAGDVPLGGVLLGACVGRPRRDPAAVATTDADGRYRFANLPADRIWLLVLCGDVRASDDFDACSRDPVAPPAGETASVDVPLPGGALRVVVLDSATGDPIAGAAVTARPADPRGLRDVVPGFALRPGWADFTGEDGIVSLPGLPPSATHEVRVRADGHEEGRASTAVPGSLAHPTEIVIRLRRR